jgi:hypothetical protein
VEDIAVLVAASPTHDQEQSGLIPDDTGARPPLHRHTTAAHPGEVTPERCAQLDTRLQAVEAAVSQLCTLQEQTLQRVARLYDVMTAQQAQDIQTITAVLRKAQQSMAQMRVRPHTPASEPSSGTCALAVPWS